MRTVTFDAAINRACRQLPDLWQRALRDPAIAFIDISTTPMRYLGNRNDAHGVRGLTQMSRAERKITVFLRDISPHCVIHEVAHALSFLIELHLHEARPEQHPSFLHLYERAVTTAISLDPNLSITPSYYSLSQPCEFYAQLVAYTVLDEEYDPNAGPFHHPLACELWGYDVIEHIATAQSAMTHQLHTIIAKADTSTDALLSVGKIAERLTLSPVCTDAGAQP